jgi:hypothetical protein
MAAVNTNLTIEQGSDYNIDLTIDNDDGTPLILTGYTAQSKVRKHYGSTSYQDFTIEFVDRLAGEIRLSMGSSITSSLSEGRYVYDIVLTDPNLVKLRVVQGNVLVNPGVTL